MANVDPYQDVKDDAERLTKARLAKSNETVANDLKIEPLVQAVTPNDAKAKLANTGGVDVAGSPDKYNGPVSDGFVDGADEAAIKASKSGK
jgi:hypothetical protein